MKDNQPLISVCIPVFSTEPFLAQCLRSVMRQDFSDFEVVIVSDASRGKDEYGRNARKIVRKAQKECNSLRKGKALPPVPFRFIEHRENRGLIEVRRTLCYEARGFYITQLDSDDELEEGALSALYAASGKELLNPSAYDIVHGTSTAGTFTADGIFVPSAINRYGTIFYGKITGRDVLHRWLVGGEFTANTWGKLIKRELWQKAYKNIPYTECNMADDVLLFFFIAQYAGSYIGIENKVYRYRINSGMSSTRKIDTLHKWKMICSTASVFSVIATWHAQNSSQQKLLPEELAEIQKMTRFYLANNIQQMREVVIPGLQDEARKMLCEFWGEHFVQTVEAQMQVQEQTGSGVTQNDR